MQHIQGWTVGDLKAVLGPARKVLSAQDDIGMRVSCCCGVLARIAAALASPRDDEEWAHPGCARPFFRQ